MLCAGCHAIAGLDYEVDDGSGAAASSSSDSSGPTSSSSSSGTACPAPLFHVSFDEPTNDSWLGSALVIDQAGERVTDPIRLGAGAWRLPVAAEAQRASLDSFAPQEGHEYWLGFSHLHQGPGIAPATRIFALECLVDPMPSRKVIFGIEMRGDDPLHPYWEGQGTTASQLQIDQPISANDDLPLLPAPNGFTDWIVRFRLARDATGFIDVFHDDDAAQVYSVVGKTVEDACNGTFRIRMGLYRNEAGAPAQSAVIDEVTLLEAPPDPLPESVLRAAVKPGSPCFVP